MVHEISDVTPNLTARDDRTIALLLAILMVYNPIVDGVNAVTNIFFSRTPLDTLAAMVLTAALTIKSWPYLIKTTYKVLAVVIWVFIMLCMFSAWINFRNISIFMSEISNYVIAVSLMVPMFLLLGAGAKDFDSLLKYLKILVPIALIAGSIQYFTLVSSEAAIVDDNMSFAYSIMPSVLLTLYFSFKKWKSIYPVFAVLGLVLIIMAGTRGPILCLIAYIGIYIAANLRSVKVILASLLAAGITLWWVFSDHFMSSVVLMQQVFMGKGISTRILDALLEGTYLNTKSRDMIFEITQKAIIDHPFLGSGLFGDRVALRPLSYLPGLYPHNIVLEILCQFGVILGVLLMGLLVYLIIKTYFKESPLGRDIILLIMPLAIIKLFISNSYMEEPYFFLLLGICLKNLIGSSSQYEHNNQLTAVEIQKEG